MECKHGCEQHNCSHYGSSTTQTLEELDFERGIWNAAIKGNVKKVQELLVKGCNVNQLDNAGYTALHYAARAGNLEMCKLLLSKNANVNSKTRSDTTPLHRAAFCGNVEIVQLLIDHGANIYTQDQDGKNALHKAVEQGHERVIQLLLQAATQEELMNCKDKFGRTPFDYKNLNP